LISGIRHVVNIVFFLLGSSPTSEFFCAVVSGKLCRLDKKIPVKIEETECSETSAEKIQKPGNHPKERIQFLVQLKIHIFWDLLLFCIILEKIVDLFFKAQEFQ
jgi:hypothetical protein